MNRKTTSKIMVITAMASLIICTLAAVNNVSAVPNPPHQFWGTTQDDAGKNISAGITVRAWVIDPISGNDNTTQAIANGGYGTPYTGAEFNVNNSDIPRDGYPIYFYIGSLNTSQSKTFSTGGTTEFNLTVEDKPRILEDNSNDTNQTGYGYTGDPYIFNVTIGEYVDSGAELTVRVNWTHGSHTGFVDQNYTLNHTGGDNINGLYFNRTITLDNYSVANLTYVIHVWDTSSHYNYSAQQNVTVLDNKKPITTLSVGESVHPDSAGNNTNVTSDTTFYLNGTDNIGQYYIHYRIWNDTHGWSDWTMGSGNTNITFNFSSENQGEGTHYIQYYANDTANNTENTHNITYYCDDSTPTTTMTIAEEVHPDDGASGCNVTSSTHFTLTATDNPAAHNSSINTIWYTINGTYNEYNGSYFDLSSQTTGWYNITWGSIDNLGNNETGNHQIVWIDDSAPNTTLSIAEEVHPNGVTNGTNITSSTLLNLTAADNPAHGSGVQHIMYRYWNSSNGWTTWTTYNGNFSLGSDSGKYYLEYNATDNLNNTEETQNVTLWVDNAAPTTSIVVNEEVHPNMVVNGTNITSATTINLTALDNPAHNASVQHIMYRYWNSSNGWTTWTTYNGNFSLGSDSGKYYLEYNATDNLNNTEETQNVTLWVDNAAPATNLTINEQVHPNTGITGVNLTSSTLLQLNATDLPATHNASVNYSEYRYWNSSSGWTTWTTYTTPFNLGADNGKYYLEYRSIDMLGNQENTSNVTLWIDNEVPQTNLSIGSPQYPLSPNDGCNVTNTTRITLTATDYPLAHNASIAFTWYTIDSDYYVGTSFNLSSYAEGSHTIEWGSQDNLGHNETNNSITVWVDNTPPTTNMSIGAPKYPLTPNNGCNVTNTTLFTLSAVDNPVHNSSVNYTWYTDNGNYHVYSTPFTLTGQGQHTITYGSIDNLGNNETAHSITVWVDTTPPTTNLNIAEEVHPDAGQNGSNVTSSTHFILTAVDNPAHNSSINTTWYTINGTFYVYNGSYFDLSGQPEGWYIIAWGSIDNLGNNETAQSQVVWIDDTAPTTTLETGSPLFAPNYVNLTTPFYLNATDAGHTQSYQIYYRIWNTTAGWSSWINGTWNQNITFNFTEECIHHIQYYAKDHLNNTETYNSTINNETYNCDATAPTVNISTPYNYTNANFTVTWNATDAKSGVRNYTIQYKNDTGAWTNWFTNISYNITSATWNISNTTEGTTVYFRGLAVDNLSNIGSFSANASTTKDTTRPNSTVQAISSFWQNSTPITITANGSDAVSGLKNVTLHYYWNETSNSSTNFTQHEYTVNTTPWINTSSISWSFNFPQGRGYYRFYSIAADNATNTELAPATNDTQCYYNNSLPNITSNPSPSDGSTSQSITSDLSWTGGDPDANDTVTYTVYFGTDSTPDSGELKSSNQSSTSYDVGTLAYSRTYYWQIIAYDNHGARREGPIWDFTTRSAPSSGPGPTPPANSAPVADANGPYTAYTGQSKTYDASDSTDSDGSITGYRWDWNNDGTYDTSWLTTATTTHTYTTSGIYTVKLQVKDNNDATDTDTTTATISDQPEDTTPPVADANGPYEALENETLTLDASDSTDSDGYIAEYYWDFGDGNTSTVFNPQHTYTYATPGTYNITLTVTDDDGLTNTTTTTATILADSDHDGWSDHIEQAYGTNISDPNDTPQDTDNDGIPDDPSPDGNYTGDDDDDGDGLTDEEENTIGSNPQSQDDVTQIISTHGTFFFVDNNGDGKPDAYYNPTTNVTTMLNPGENNTYLVDTDGDGTWDYTYNAAATDIDPYEEEQVTPQEPWPIILVFLAVIAVIVLIAVLYRKNYF